MQAHASARAPTLARTHARTHKYIIIFALSLQQWFRDCASLLPDTYIACLVRINLDSSVHVAPSCVKRFSAQRPVKINHNLSRTA